MTGAADRSATDPRSEAPLSAGPLRAALEVAERWLAANRDAVNAVNVYPVPDGDTGTNMLLTWRAALRAGADAPTGEAVGPYLAAMARGALLGACGNSGVILSQMLAGLARACEQVHALDGARIAEALTAASETAYAAVTHPVEGTMLTVLREAAVAAQSAARSAAASAVTIDAAGVLRAAVEEAQASVQRTPQLLARLREAGVVDAGGLGVAVLLEGWRRGLTGEALPEAPVAAAAPVNLDAVAHEGHGYCTEFVVTAAPGASLDRAAIEAALVAAGGESILVVGDRDAVHVHVHLGDPGPALTAGAARGALASVKVENMQAQHEAWLAEHEGPRGTAEARPQPAIGLVAVAQGGGIAAAFRDLGATHVLSGTDGGKVSAGELLEAARAAASRHAVLLPNDKDVLMAAARAAEEAPGFVAVIATRSIAAGLSAAVAYQPEGDLALIVAAMTAAADAVRSVEVTRSVRTAVVDGVSVREGEPIALVDGTLVAAAGTLEDALLAGLAAAGAASAELATLYLGADAEAGTGIEALIAERYPHLEVQSIAGGQPHYAYLAGVE